MALRDPRNKSRNKTSRRTSAATRSKRSATSAKYNPKPTSSSQRSGKKGSSKKVTTGKGGTARLNKALDSVKAKPRTVRTNPPSSTPRGAQGPRTAPQQGPSQRVNTRGLIGSRSKPKTTKAPPRSATPNASRVGEQIKQAKRVQKANPGREARAARNAKLTPKQVVAALASGAKGGVKGLSIATAKKILESSGTKGAAKMSRLGIGGNAPVSKPKPKPTPKKPKPVQKKPIKGPAKKGSTVLAKRGGKEGVMRNGVFYATGWSPSQRNRYQIQRIFVQW